MHVFILTLLVLSNRVTTSNYDFISEVYELYLVQIALHSYVICYKYKIIFPTKMVLIAG